MYIGYHYTLDFEGDSPEILNDLPLLRDLCLEFCATAGVTVIHSHFHQFEPQGVTGAIVIAESHLTIHTWPEYAICAIDFFTCKKDISKPNPNDFFVARLMPKKHRVHELSRNSE
jgi:S-adenosylmethionine decarboxylase proenzyme